MAKQICLSCGYVSEIAGIPDCPTCGRTLQDKAPAKKKKKK